MNIVEIIYSKIPLGNRFERIWKIAQVDFKRRYYNDRLGLLWALLNPILTVIIYWFVFDKIIGRVSAGIENYALYLFSGIIFWIAFVEMIKKGMKTLSQKRYLIENIKVNIEDLFLSSSLSILLAFLFNLLAFILTCIFFGCEFSFILLFLPILVLNVFLFGCGIGMILSILFIHFRDITHLVDLILMLGFWTSGIFFKAELIYNFSPAIYYLNPFVGIIDNARNITMYNTYPNMTTINLNFLVGVLTFIIGFIVVTKYTQKAMEKI